MTSSPSCKKQLNAILTSGIKLPASSATRWRKFREPGSKVPTVMKQRKRVGLLLALGFALIPLGAVWSGGQKSADSRKYFVGKVVKLADLLAKSNTKIDADCAPYL